MPHMAIRDPDLEQKVRVRFEAWASRRGMDLTTHYSALAVWTYEDDDTRAAFKRWLIRAGLYPKPQDLRVQALSAGSALSTLTSSLAP